MFFNLINNIKINYKNKKKIILINKKNNYKQILIKLVELNIIKYVITLKNNYILILNYFKKKKLIFNIKNKYKTSCIKYIKLKNIKKINKKNKIILISSNKGILNNFEAGKKKIGGILIIYIWN